MTERRGSFSRALIQAERLAGKPTEALRLVKRFLRAAHADQIQPSRFGKGDPFMPGPDSPETQHALLAFFTRSKPDGARALDSMSLRGKTLFFTGASRGIGLAIAVRAARDGANSGCGEDC